MTCANIAAIEQILVGRSFHVGTELIKTAFVKLATLGFPDGATTEFLNQVFLDDWNSEHANQLPAGHRLALFLDGADEILCTELKGKNSIEFLLAQECVPGDGGACFISQGMDGKQLKLQIEYLPGTHFWPSNTRVLFRLEQL